MFQNEERNSNIIGNKEDNNSYNEDYEKGYSNKPHQSNNPNNINSNINNNSQVTSQQQQQAKLKQQKDNQRFNIIVRIRPQVEHDTVELTTEDELRHCIFKQGQNQILLNNEKTDNEYKIMFDYVFDENDNQETLYNAFGDKLLKDIFRGYNGTIMAYGQTGSGKTYTMFGPSIFENQGKVDTRKNDPENGIVQRAIKQIFEYKNQNKNNNVKISVSFMQIYLNQITDLLDENSVVMFTANKPEFPSTNRPKFRLGKESKDLRIEKSLKIRHDKDGKIIVEGLQVKEVKDENDLFLLIEGGIVLRKTAETIMNKISSRSHAILQITIEQRWCQRINNNSNGETVDNIHKIKGVLTIVDLAGSESISRTGSEGIHQDEAKEINKSISALGRVIESLSRHSKYLDMKGLNEKNSDFQRNYYGSNEYIPYRDSRLTEILSEFLGGNSKTYIIANVSPFAANYEETYSTLQFARRAMVIHTYAKKNEKISTKKFNKDQENSVNNLGFINNNNQTLNNNQKKNKVGNNNNLSGIGNTSGYGIGGYRNKSVASNGYNKYFGIDKNYNNKEQEGIEKKKEDYQAIAKKFYSIILYLQEELGQLTLQNYKLEQENNFLKDQLKNID
jgi:kinesin family protein 5